MQATKTKYLTSEIATLFGVGRNTLRLYEERGLLTGMDRTESGYREYSTAHVERLQFILDAKKSGFTLQEIKALLQAFDASTKITCGVVSQEVQEKMQQIESEVQILVAKKAFLQKFVVRCSSKRGENPCDILRNGFTEKACC